MTSTKNPKERKPRLSSLQIKVLRTLRAGGPARAARVLLGESAVSPTATINSLYHRGYISMLLDKNHTLSPPIYVLNGRGKTALKKLGEC